MARQQTQPAIQCFNQVNNHFWADIAEHGKKNLISANPSFKSCIFCDRLWASLSLSINFFNTPVKNHDWLINIPHFPWIGIF